MDSCQKILVVEDEIIIADNIVKSLNSIGYSTLEPALNFSQAIEAIEQERPNLAIIDIRLSGIKDGVDLANIINTDYHFPFIFLTSNSDHQTLERAKQTKPSAYLLKPFTKQDLYTSIEIALFNFYDNGITMQEATGNETFILIKQGLEYHKVDFEDIIYLKSNHVYLDIYTVKKEKYVIRTSLTEYLKKFPVNFKRTHRSFAVNVKFIEKITSTQIFLSGEIIPLSKDYRKDLIKNFG